jgi:hypothetical protein
MADRGSWRVEIGRPEAAIRLPIGESGDLSAWAEMTARSRVGYDADEEMVEEFARMVLECAADSASRAPMMAFLMPVEDEPVELLRIEVRDLNPDEAVPEITLDWLEQQLLRPPAEPVVPPYAVRGDLPSGPAVRVYQRVIDDVDEFGDGTLTQTVVYAVRPHGTDFAVLITVSWKAVLLNDELFALVDELAQSLVVSPA